MKKKLFVLIIFTFLLFSTNVNAITGNYSDFDAALDPIKTVGSTTYNNLIYSIDEMKSTSNKITFKGFAYLNYTNSYTETNVFSGHPGAAKSKSYKISIIAISKNSWNDIKNSVKNKNTSDYIEKYSSKYEGGWGLYPSNCLLGACNDYPVNSKCAGPGNSAENTCAHYNPFFTITFSLKDLKDKFGTGKDIVFIIKITSGSDIYARALAVNEDVKKGIKNSAVGYGLNISTSKTFKNYSASTLKLYSTSYGYKGIGGATFATSSGTGYAVSSQVRGKIRGVNYVDLSQSSEIWLYKLSDDTSFYASSVWGVLSGATIINITTPPEPSPPSCGSGTSTNNGCIDSIYNLTNCEKLITYKKNAGTVFNEDGCTNTSSYEFRKVYVFDESSKIDLLDTFKDASGNYNFKNGGKYLYYSGLEPGRSLFNDTGFKFTRTLSFSQKDSNIYYYVNYYYKNGYGTCTPDSGYVTYDYLTSKISPFLVPDDSEFKESIASMVSGTINSTYGQLDYSYPNSNDFKASKYEYNAGENPAPDKTVFSKLSSSKSCYSTLDSTDFTLNGGVYSYTCENEFKLKQANINYNKNAYVVYSNSSLGNEYIKDQNKYYFAFNVPLNNSVGGSIANSNLVIFKTGIKNYKVFNNSSTDTLNNTCKIAFKEDSLFFNNLLYRVVDLHNPFPNYNASSYPLNWTAWDKWSAGSGFDSYNNKDYLLERTKEPNAEKYIITLSNNKLIEVRNDTGSGFKYSVESILDENGESVYIKNHSDIFKKENTNISKPGESSN